MLYGAAYYPEHRDPARWDFDLDNMAAAHVNALRVGEFAWKRFEPREGEYDFEWMDRFAEKAAARGIRLLVCPPLRTAPAWLVERDRDVLIENAEGVRLEFGSRYTFCINHPLLREKGFALAGKMAEHWAASDAVLGWHLDNEYGDEPDCHCPVCAGKFREWLAGRYGSIGELNRRWGTVFWGLEFDDFGQVTTPRLSKTWFGPGHLQAWRTFRSECTVETVRLHAEEVRRFARQPVTTNNQPLWNNRTDYFAMARHLDVCGTNYYPPYGESCRASALGLANVRAFGERGFHVHELRNSAHATPGRADNAPGPGEVERLVAHVVANGADAVFFFRWRACPFGCEQNHGTITDYDGRPNRVYAEAGGAGQRLARMAGLLDGTEVRGRVALLYDYPTRWMWETGTAWQGPKDLYNRHATRLYAAVRSLGIDCDATGRDRDWGRYRVLVVPMLMAVDDDLVARLRAYVEGGGVLVWHPLSGDRDADGTIYPDRLHPDLGGLLGVDVRDYTTAGPDEKRDFVWEGGSAWGSLFFNLPELRGAEARGLFTDCWFADAPAVTENSAGSGRAISVHTYAGEAFYADFLGRLCDQAGVERILGGGVPAAVEVTERSAPDGRRLVFLLNCSDVEQWVPLAGQFPDVWNDETVGGEVSLAPHAVRVLDMKEA